VLLGEFEGPPRLAQVSKGTAEAAQGAALVAAVTDLAGDGQPLQIALDGSLRLAQVSVGAAEAAQDSALTATVAKHPCGLGRRL
jgi:hypothetical protein